jgi:hypothetical protein
MNPGDLDNWMDIAQRNDTLQPGERWVDKPEASIQVSRHVFEDLMRQNKKLENRIAELADGVLKLMSHLADLENAVNAKLDDLEGDLRVEMDDRQDELETKIEDLEGLITQNEEA